MPSSRTSCGLTASDETTLRRAASQSNWEALLLLLVMLVASCFAHRHLVAFGTAFLTFSALTVTPALLDNLDPRATEPADAQPLLGVSTAERLVALAVTTARRSRVAAWIIFLLGVAIVVGGIAVAENSLDTRLSGLIFATGFTLCFLAYTGLVCLRLGYLAVEGKTEHGIARSLGTAQAAAWAGSAAFTFGSLLIFADAMIG